MCRKLRDAKCGGALRRGSEGRPEAPRPTVVHLGYALATPPASDTCLTTASTRRVPRLRWRIAGLIGAGVLINYFDRISISVAGPQLERSFDLTPVDLGVLFSAFFWS